MDSPSLLLVLICVGASAGALIQSTSTLFVAEFGLLDPPMQTCSALDAYSPTCHLQAINLFPGQADVATELQNTWT